MADAAHPTEPSVEPPPAMTRPAMARPAMAQPAMAQRASDLERQAVVDHLRAATSEGRLSLDEFEERVGLVLGSQTHAELAPVTADLPPMVGAATGVPAVPASADGPSTERRRRLVSVFAHARHAGPWEAGRMMTVVAVFGHSHVDLAACRLPPGVRSVELRTFGVFAGIEVVVPPGAVVDVGGITMFGGRHLRHRPVEQAEPGLHVRVRSYGAFGGVLVRSNRKVP